MKRILFNEINLSQCDLYYCEWCKDFGKKSKMEYNDNTDSHQNKSVGLKKSTITDLTCTKCGQYLIRDGKIRDPKHDDNKSKPENFTLKEVLNSFKSQATLLDNRENISIISSATTKTTSENNSVISSECIFDDESSTQNEMPAQTTPNNSIGDSSELTNAAPMNPSDKIKSLLANTQFTKSKLDEIAVESRRINNNLKLYFTIKVLNESTTTTGAMTMGEKETIGGVGQQQLSASGVKNEDESLLCSFKMRYVLVLGASGTTVVDGRGRGGGDEERSSIVENCLCMFTNRSIFVFRVVFQELFEMNKDFDKCLTKEHLVEINQIEIIELSLVQNYLILEVAKEGETKMFLKFVTFDVYQTQTILNTLLSNSINNDKQFPRVF